MGGIVAADLKDVTIQLDGTLSFSKKIKDWPRKPLSGVHLFKKGDALDCLVFNNTVNLTLTSSGTGTLEGNGEVWWGIPGIGYLVRQENRPKLIEINYANNTLVENFYFHNSPYWTFNTHHIEGMEIRFSSINNRRTEKDDHGIIDMTAFNTDGFDMSGNNIWVHDCDVWNQDDTFCVKGTSNNITFERIRASGIGLTIGSISNDTVQNVTFRDAYMHNPYKGIYMKFKRFGLIKDITYENIVIDSPSQTPIWIGPAQQSDSLNLCAAHPCSLCWPTVPFAECKAPYNGTYENILLKNITINNAKHSPGVLIAHPDTPMKNITFEDVVFNNPGTKPFGPDYHCENVQGVAKGKTWPVPKCMDDQTDRKLNETETSSQKEIRNEIVFLQ